MALRNLGRYQTQIDRVEEIIGHALPSWQRELIGDMLEIEENVR